MSIKVKEAPESWYNPDPKENPCATAWKRHYDGLHENLKMAIGKIREQAERISYLESMLKSGHNWENVLRDEEAENAKA